MKRSRGHYSVLANPIAMAKETEFTWKAHQGAWVVRDSPLEIKLEAIPIAVASHGDLVLPLPNGTDMG